ncbi:MAG: hypothetical protein OXI84_01115 [bacterium]|nr:hypothetical protein [bacterium]
MWQVRVIPYNLGGDGPTRETTYLQLSNEAEYNAWAKDHIIEQLEGDWSWLRTVWDFLHSDPGVNIDTYGGDADYVYSVDYDGNAALVWKHLRRFQATDSTNASFRVVPLNYFCNLFGG